jgi:hypothetical protein
LVAVSASGVLAGELVSLAYHLDDRVGIRGAGEPGVPVTLPDGLGSLVVLSPSAELGAAIGPQRVAKPIAGTWQWFLVRR